MRCYDCQCLSLVIFGRVSGFCISPHFRFTPNAYIRPAGLQFRQPIHEALISTHKPDVARAGYSDREFLVRRLGLLQQREQQKLRARSFRPPRHARAFRRDLGNARDLERISVADEEALLVARPSSIAKLMADLATFR